MRYIKSFESFKLLLEKILKDDDYYTAREDLDPYVKFIKDEFTKLNQKIRSSVGTVKKDDNIEETLKEVNDLCTKYKEENKYPDTDLLGMSQARKLFTSLNKMIIDKLNGTYGNGFKVSDYLRDNIFHVGSDSVWSFDNQYDNNSDLDQAMFLEYKFKITNILAYIKQIKSYLDEKFEEFSLDKISKSNMSETRSKLASIFYKIMKDIHGFDLPKDFHEKLNRMIGTTFDKKANLSYVSFTIGSMGQEGGGEFVNFPIKNVEVSGKTISEIDVDSIGKKPLIKILEFLNELVFSIINPEDPKKKEVKKLLRDMILQKKDIDIKKIAKNFKMRADEIEEIKKEFEEELEEEEIEKMEYKPEPLEFSDSESKNIHLWDKMIEEFREFGKKLYDKDIDSRVNFDIQVDKFKLFLQKKGYEIPIKSDFGQTISTPMIDELKNPNSEYKQFLEMPEFMNACLQSSSKKDEKYIVEGVIIFGPMRTGTIGDEYLRVIRTSDVRLDIWKRPSGNPVSSKEERFKLGISDDICIIKPLIPCTLSKSKIKLGKKTFKSGNMVSIKGFGLNPLIIVSEDDIDYKRN